MGGQGSDQVGGCGLYINGWSLVNRVPTFDEVVEEDEVLVSEVRLSLFLMVFIVFFAPVHVHVGRGGVRWTRWFWEDV